MAEPNENNNHYQNQISTTDDSRQDLAVRASVTTKKQPLKATRKAKPDVSSENLAPYLLTKQSE